MILRAPEGENHHARKLCIPKSWVPSGARSLRERTGRELQSAGRLGIEGSLRFSSADLHTLDSRTFTDKLSHSVKTAARRQCSRSQVCGIVLGCRQGSPQAARTLAE